MAKRRAGSQTASLTLDHKKSGIDPITCLQRACDIPLERSWQELKLCFRPHLYRRSVCKVMGLQSRGSPNLGDFSRLPLGSPRTKSHSDVSFVASHKVYYKGEGGGFPQVEAVVSLVCPCCPWLVLTPKVFKLCTNHLVWVLCRPVWVSEACQLFLVPSRSSSTPLYPSKCYEPGSVHWLPPFLLFFTWIHIWVPRGVRSASIGLHPLHSPPFVRVCFTPKHIFLASWAFALHI
jgi:hypothetical protein